MAIIGYTAGVFDMFHIGHLNVLKNAKAKCDYLVVGVSTDDVVKKNKNKSPVISYEERKAIVEAIRFVDKVVPQTGYDIASKIKAAIDNRINIMFVGSDWKGTDKWNIIEKQLAQYDVKVEYLPHTDGVSSTMLSEVLKRIYGQNS